MPSLKELRQRITSVKSTQKITSAMKMVAASKLRKAQLAVQTATPYAEHIEKILKNLSTEWNGQIMATAPPLLIGNRRSDTYLLVMVTANRGLCGGFTTSVVREVRRAIAALLGENKSVHILCIGRKGYDQIKRDYDEFLLEPIEDFGNERGAVSFSQASSIAKRIISLFELNVFDVCIAVFNHFQSAVSQVVTQKQIVPFLPLKDKHTSKAAVPDIPYKEAADNLLVQALYEYEPSAEEVLSYITSHNVVVQMFKVLLESIASEQGARMTAMDSATRNASDMIKKLTLTYNRTRQSYITRELIEIISGAEAL